MVTLGLRVGCGQTSRNESEVISHEICSLNEEVDQNLKARGDNVVSLMAQKLTQLNIIEIILINLSWLYINRFNDY